MLSRDLSWTRVPKVVVRMGHPVVSTLLGPSWPFAFLFLFSQGSKAINSVTGITFIRARCPRVRDLCCFITHTFFLAVEHVLHGPPASVAHFIRIDIAIGLYLYTEYAKYITFHLHYIVGVVANYFCTDEAQFL